MKRTGFDVCICRSVDVFKIIGNIYENPELLEVP
ncbi:YopX family protein [Enterococcus avium]|nr:YopX family protein [Enterococcus avium]